MRFAQIQAFCMGEEKGGGGNRRKSTITRFGPPSTKNLAPPLRD